MLTQAQQKQPTAWQNLHFSFKKMHPNWIYS